MTLSVAAVIVAAGRGLRAGGDVPKQYRSIATGPAVRASLRLFAEHREVDLVQPVIHSDDTARFAQATSGLELLPAVPGGATRQASVRAGLEALAGHRPDVVLVHDAARPFASAALVTRAIAATASTGAAIPVLPVSDTVKLLDPAGQMVEATLDRSRLRVVQTPQAFAFSVLIEAHRRALAARRDDFTDDAALAEWAGLKVAVFDGEPGNLKLTTPEDFARLEAKQSEALADIRTGTGFDVHAFAAGDHVMLAGVKIAHEYGLTGHSDADVGLHALTDAVLGPLADGDIGAHFPPTDPQWRGATSDRFLAFAAERVRARGGRIAHLDLTLVCEAPRIGPHRDAMRARIAAIAGVTL